MRLSFDHVENDFVALLPAGLLVVDAVGLLELPNPGDAEPAPVPVGGDVEAGPPDEDPSTTGDVELPWIVRAGPRVTPLVNQVSIMGR